LHINRPRLIGAVGVWFRGLSFTARARDRFTTWVAGCALGYIGFLIVSYTVADAAMPFNYRILLPMLPLAAVALIAGSSSMLARLARSWPMTAQRTRAALTLVVTLGVLLHAFSTGQFARAANAEGLGYAARTWRDSATLRSVGELPPDCTIYSNAPDAIRILLGRDARAVPKQRLRRRNSLNTQRHQDLRRIADEMTLTPGKDWAVIWFDLIDRNDLLMDEATVVRGLPVFLDRTLSDGRVYRVSEIKREKRRIALQEVGEAP